MAALCQRRFLLLLTPMLCLSAVSRAQSGGASVTASGGVSQTVALSLAPGFVAAGEGFRVTPSSNPDRSLSVILSGTTCELTEVRIPLQIRSNAAYSLFATAKAGGSNLSSLLVTDARPTGSLVAADAAEALDVSAAFDGRRAADRSTAGVRLNRPNLSSRTVLLSGSRISLGGTLESQQNAVEIALSLAVEPQKGNQGWTIELLLSVAPAAHF